MNAFALSMVAIGFSLFMQSSSVFSGVYDDIAEKRYDAASQKALLNELETISIFRPGNVFLRSMEDRKEPVYGKMLALHKYNMSDEGNPSDPNNPKVFNKLPWDPLFRYGILNFARKNAATSNDLPIYWNHCMRANQQLRNFADILQYSIQGRYTNKNKVILFQSLMAHYKDSVIPFLKKSQSELQNIRFYYPGRRATRTLILKVNEKLQKAFTKIANDDYEELKTLPPQDIRPKPLPLSPGPAAALPADPNKLAESAIKSWAESTMKEEQEKQEKHKQLIEELKRSLGEKPNL